MAALLELKNVKKAYGAFTVLDAINLSVAPGETIGVVGPSGSGKSTLLNLMGALDRPTSGKVILKGEDVSGFNDTRLAGVRSQVVGFVFQLHHLLPQCTALENVMIPSLVTAGAREAESRARTLLNRVGLVAQLSKRPGQLSGGECQRTAVVRALINKPKLLLADEPTGSLDREASEALVSLLLELNKEEGTALVMVTHSTELARRMGRLMVLRDGRLSAAQ